MATENNSSDDLYSYDGYGKVTSDLLSNPEVQQHRQDSGVDFGTMADAIHNEAVGTLFASQAAANIPSQTGPHIAPRQTVDANAHTQAGPESSIFARYEARQDQRSGDPNQTICELRQWLERFELPQEGQTSDQGDVPVNTEVPHHALRKRSLSIQAANVFASRLPPRGSSDNSIYDYTLATHEPEDDDTESSAVNGRFNLLLLDALTLLPSGMTCEWDETQRARENYNSIDRAHVIRLEAEERSAKDRERNLEMSVNSWKGAEKNRNLVERDWPDGGIEASVTQELEHCEELANGMSASINYWDSRMYVIPRNWDMTDRPRRTRLYSNMFNFQKYMSIERRVMYLLETRLEDLQEGRSEQSEAAIAEEIKTIEDAIEVRSNAQRDYYDLVRDFLDWAVAHTVLEFQDMILGGPKPTRPNALTNEISLTIVEDLIEDDEEPELLERYERLRILERTFFPARFKVSPIPSKPPLTQKQPQCTPRGRQIPTRKQIGKHFSAVSCRNLINNLHDNDPDEVQSGERLTQTLPRSFKQRKGPLLRVKYLAAFNRDMVGEPTSPVKPPETDYLGPPRPKRKMLLRMKGYPKVIHEYTPEPLPPFKLNNSVTARVRYNSRTGTVINERTSKRHNPPRRFLSHHRDRRERSFREPLTPDNIDKVQERNWRADLQDIYRRRASMNYEVIKMYWKVLRQLSSRASTQWVELTHIKDSRDRNDNNVSEDDNKGTTSPVIANSSETDPFEDYEDMLDVDDFKHPEDQSFLTTLRRPDPAVRVAHPALSIQDPDVRVIDFAFPANTNRAGHINLARLIKRIEDINDPHAKKPSPVVCEEPVWWSSNAAQENSKKRCATASQLSPTVSGIEDPDIEAGLTEEVPEDEVGLFQRPIRRLEDRIGNQSKIDATEARGSDSENDTSYEAPGQAESEVLGKILTNEARYHSELDDEAANTEARSIVAEDEPVNTRTAVVRWSAQSTAGGSSGASSKQSSRDH